MKLTPLVLLALLPAPAAAQLPIQEGQLGAHHALPMLRGYVTQLGAEHYPSNQAANNDYGRAVVALPSGAVLVAGETCSSLGEAHAGSSTVRRDLFLARFDAKEKLEWIRQIGAVTAPTLPALDGNPGGAGGDATGNELVGGLAVARDGSIYVTGGVDRSLGETNGGLSDLFLAKFDREGSLEWFRQLGVDTAAMTPSPFGTLDPSHGETATAILVTPAGTVYVAGAADGSLADDNAHERSDVFLARFTSDGQLEWLRQMGLQSSALIGFDPSHWNRPQGLALHPSGSIVLVSQNLNDQTVPWRNTVTLLTFDADGTPLASKDLPTTFKDVSRGIAIERSSGRIFVAGETSGSLAEPKGGNSDAFVASFTADLELEWIRQLGSPTAASLGALALGREVVAGIRLDAAGDLIVAGETEGSWNEPLAGMQDIFTAKLRGSDGQVLWVSQFGATTTAPYGMDASHFEYTHAMDLDPGGRIVVVGGTLGDLGEENDGQSDVFVMRLTPHGTL